MTVRSRCSCCGIPCARERCPVCSLCSGRHGDALQAEILEAWRAGKIDPWLGIAMMATDDALITGRVDLRRNDHGTLDLWILETPKRWQVRIARDLAVDVMPDLESVVHNALLPFWGRDNVASARAAIERELAMALGVLDPSMVVASVSCKRAVMLPGELIIEIAQRTGPTLLPTERIPDDVYARKPASA